MPSLRGARRTALVLANYQGALPYFDAEARLTADSRRKAALFYEKGRVLEDALSDPDKARQAYRTAAELNRGDPSLLKAIQQRDREERRWRDLERTLEREANAVHADDRHRAALIVERARLLEHREKRVDAALELYETALRLDPFASGALDALERLCHGQRRWRELISVLTRRADQAGSPGERAMAFYRIGRLHEERLGNRDEAITALERALDESEDDPLVLAQLADLLERSERWERLVEVLARLTIVSSDPLEQLALWHRVGNLLDERLNRPAQAQEAFERALASVPTHVPTLQALSRLYVASEAWDSLIRMHLGEAEAAPEPRRRAAAHARVADVLETRKKAPSEAMSHHARALSLQPGFAASFKALTRLYADAGKHRALIELYERAIEQAPDPGTAITHLFKVGAIYEDTLREYDPAAHTYRRVLDLDAGHVGALHALQRATERAGRHDRLVAALEREAELLGEGPQVVDLLHRAGEILDERLGDTDGAMARFRRILELDPGYEPALSGLGRIYHRTGRWDDLLELYEQELALAPEGANAAALLHKMGQLSEERIGDELRAMDCYRRALKADPRHRPSASALARKLSVRREHEELVQVLNLELEASPDHEARARTAYRLGQIHEDHLEAPERAAAAYETALSTLPGYPPARDALARLRAHEGEWQRLVDQLDEEANLANDDATRITKLVRAGELWHHTLDDPRRAVGCYERALAIAPGHIESLLSLEQLYRRLSRHDALAKVYGSLARVLTDPGARVAALRELGRLTIASEQPTEAREVFEAILGLSPDDPGALAALEAHALATDDRELLTRIDQRLVATAGDVKIASAYQTRLAESLEVAGDGSAIDAYRAALESDPENVAAAKGLARVALAKQDPQALVEAARREAAVTPDPRRAARLLVRAGQVSQRDLRDGRTALRDFSRALELWPDDPDAAAGMTELLLSAGHAARAADRLSRAAAAATSPERVAELWMRIARLQSDLLDNVAAAITSLSRVLRESPNHVPTLRRLAELHGRQNRWAEAAEILARVVTLAPDREVLRDAHLELASIWDTRLEDAPRALVSLQAVLSLEENHPEALHRLAQLSARMGDLDKAARTLRKLVDVAPTLEQQIQAWISYSHIQGDRGDDETSRTAALHAIALGGPGGAGVERHLSLIEGNADWIAHADALRAWLQKQTEPAARRAGQVEIARIMSDELARPSRAVEVLEEAAREQPKDFELRRLLAVNLRLSGATDEAAKRIRRVLDEDPTKTDFWRELAQTHAAANQRAAAQRALMPLVLMGEATAREREEVAKYVPRPASAKAGALDTSAIEAFYPMRRTTELSSLMRLMIPAIGKLYPPDFDAYSISSRSKLTSRSTEPIRQLAERVAAIFDVEDFSLYIHRARRGVAVELSEPPSILVPTAVSDMSEAHVVFSLARAMANMSVGLFAADRLTPRELEIVLAAISRRVSEGYGAGLTSEEIFDDVGKRLYKALPRRSRKSVEECARAYVGAQPIDFAHYVEAIVTSANRIALVIADDFTAAIDVMKKSERELAELSGKNLLRHSTVSRLARFWVSPEAELLRQRCAMKGRQPTG